ncbi:MAG: diphthine--ammonia ligase [Halobacteriota archaeon]
MCGLTGVFNNEKSVELAITGLEVLKTRETSCFWICTENGEWLSEDIQELRQIACDKKSKNCIACCCSSSCSGKTTHLKESSRCRFVADAEIYNLNELKEIYNLKGENSHELLLQLAENARISLTYLSFLKRTEGAFAFTYWINDELYIAHDILGLKPVWFAHTDGFAFASEQKAVEAMGYPHAIALDPRVFLNYNIKEDRLIFAKIELFTVAHEIKKDKEALKTELLNLLRESISRRVPQGEKFGVLFSGGLDSTIIAYLCKASGADFVCYTVAVEAVGMKKAEDLRYAKRVAADLDLNLKLKTVRLDELAEYLKAVVPLVEDTDVVKVGVALPMYVACEAAKEDGIRTVFSGLGAEELFAGYERHKRVRREDLNTECLTGLLLMHDRDLYRDYLTANSHGISLRVPFLDLHLVNYALKLPASYKLTDAEDKLILRELAKDQGLTVVATRKKRAAQYGSNTIKAIEKLAKLSGYRYKRDYLRTFLPSRNIKLGCLFSSGKDSTYALWLMRKAGYPVECLITLKSRNPVSYMFHTPAVELVEQQAEAIGLPLVMKQTEGEKEKELDDLQAALLEAKETYGIEGVITGALWSNYQRERIERVATEENLKLFSPLWHINQETEMRLVVSNFEVIFSGVSAYGLDKSWLGRRITGEDVDRLVELAKRCKLNIAGEGGEFESLVLDGPMFRKRLVIVESEIVEEDENTARLIVNEVRLEGKEI